MERSITRHSQADEKIKVWQEDVPLHLYLFKRVSNEDYKSSDTQFEGVA